MKGKYKDKEGNELTVLEFDEPNKIVRVEHNGRTWWSPKHEYDTWQPIGETKTVTEGFSVTNEPEPTVPEEPKKKRTTKKKTK